MNNHCCYIIFKALLRHFKENPPIRTVKFIWYGSEEVGLLGSHAYLKAHEEELKKHLLMINIDVGGSILGQEEALITAEQSLVDYVDHMAKIKGFPLKVTQDIYSSDSIINSAVFPIEKKIPDNMRKELDKYFNKEETNNLV